MPIPKKFEASKRGLVNFAYVDVVTGRSLQRLKLGQGGSTITHHLSFNDFDSFPLHTQLQVPGSDPLDSEQTDIDYDLAVDRAFVIEGDVKGMMTIGGEGESGNNMTFYFKMIIRHFDGSTETDLVTIESNHQTVASGAEKAGIMSAFGTATRQVFAPGDKLRVTLKIFAGFDGSGGAKCMWAHDPRNGTAPGTNNATFEALTMRNEVLLPFRVVD